MFSRCFSKMIPGSVAVFFWFTPGLGVIFHMIIPSLGGHQNTPACSRVAKSNSTSSPRMCGGHRRLWLKQTQASWDKGYIPIPIYIYNIYVYIYIYIYIYYVWIYLFIISLSLSLNAISHVTGRGSCSTLTSSLNLDKNHGWPGMKPPSS